jgi:hypothetical protein
MTIGAETKDDLSPQNSRKGAEVERRERIRTAEGAVLLLLEVAGPMMVLGLVILSAIANLSG